MLSGKFEEYKQLSQFRDLKDFNNHFEQWMLDIKDNFTKSQLIALKRLVRYSASIQGVCYAKIQTIVAATHKLSEMGSISRSTFERMLRKAKQFGLIEVINTKSKSGRQAHNVYVFQPYKSYNSTDAIKNEVAKGEKIEVPKESIILSKTSNQLIDLRTNKRVRNNSPEFVSSWVNKEFAKLASYFMQPKEVNELWRISFIHGKQFNLCSGDVVEVALDSFKALISKLKAKRIINPMGYYSNTIKRKMHNKYTFDLLSSIYGK